MAASQQIDTVALDLQPSRNVGHSLNDEAEEGPTASHVLAQEDSIQPKIDQGGTEPLHENSEVEETSWQDDDPATQPLIGYLANEDTWALIRRFNKQVSHLKTVNTGPLTNLDMNIAAEEDLHPDKLRVHAERLYIAFAIPVLCLYKHVVRLRSWRETRRTFMFFSVYFIAWLADLLVSTLLGFLILLIASPSVRKRCFPPAPPLVMDPKTGALKDAPPGLKSSYDSMTGVPEKHKGETVEKEARSLVKSISKLVMNIGSGDYSEADPNDSHIAQSARQARDATEGLEDEDDGDQTQELVSRAVHRFGTRTTLQLLPDLADLSERLANALNPKHPFPTHRARLTLAACLLPLLLLSLLASWQMIMKTFEFVAGAVFFGKPVMMYIVRRMDTAQPGWRHFTQLRNSVLRGVPTNIQLTMTILRMGESLRAPVPPPPAATQPASSQEHVEVPDVEHLYTPPEEEEEEHAALEPGPTQKNTSQNETQDKLNITNRVVGHVKSTAKTTVRGLLRINKTKEKFHAAHIHENSPSMLKSSRHAANPVRFPSRYKGNKGCAFITTTGSSPAIRWEGEKGQPDLTWTVNVGNISELNKVGGLGWKRKILVRLAMDQDLTEGLTLKEKGGEEYCLTSITWRDEMFNRLASMESQMWEVI